MTFDEYQAQTKLTAVYPLKLTTEQQGVGGIAYCALGAAGEAGEIANKVKKLLRDDEGIITNKFITETLDEIGDCLWYLAQLSERLGASLNVVALRNLDKLAARKQRATLHGSGDAR